MSERHVPAVGPLNCMFGVGVSRPSVEIFIGPKLDKDPYTYAPAILPHAILHEHSGTHETAKSAPDPEARYISSAPSQHYIPSHVPRPFGPSLEVMAAFG
jgi:hypothetical protein